MTLNNGFYTALGTPLDNNGDCIPSSLYTHIEQQIQAGASGLLLMGSMGIEAAVKNSTYRKLVATASQTVRGRLPLFVGAMDNSITKVLEKVELMGKAEVAGVVVTTPFYSLSSEDELVNWFLGIADQSRYPVYLYDLPAVTKVKITHSLIRRIGGHTNIQGMKTADLQLILDLMREPELMRKFHILYSGLDLFDYANRLNIKRNLDGMFCVTPRNAGALYACLCKEDYTGARLYLDRILRLRNTMVENRLFPSFTYAMNLLGCAGNFAPDYAGALTPEQQETIAYTMQQIGER